ncbi:unnamed protein product [Boreogadus saida]
MARREAPGVAGGRAGPYPRRRLADIVISPTRRITSPPGPPLMRPEQPESNEQQGDEAARGNVKVERAGRLRRAC